MSTAVARFYYGSAMDVSPIASGLSGENPAIDLDTRIFAARRKTVFNAIYT
jgi:hypothetical protein